MSNNIYIGMEDKYGRCYARREGEKILTSRWGGQIKTKSVFENGKLHHIAYCVKTGNTARKPKDLM